MKYKLVRQLRDAGFPQLLDGQGVFVDRTEEVYADMIMYRADVVYVPTLSELIIECGTQFWKLEQGKSMYAELTGQWTCWYWENIEDVWMDGRCTFGNSPEEAVARAWLAINVPRNGEAPQQTDH